jgi:hypothetical protein
MGLALQVETGHVTNAGGTITACTVATGGDSFTPAAFATTDQAHLVGAWAANATGGVLRIRSPRLHDPAQGIRLQIPASDTVNMIPLESWQPIYPVDPMVVEMSGGASETDIVSLLYYYSNLPGVAAPLAMYSDILPRIVNLVGVEVDVTTTNSPGNYTGSRALNQDYQNLRAGESYALLGYTCLSTTLTGTLRITGPDTGKVGVGGPYSSRTDLTSSWFMELSRYLQKPTIPVIQANNAAATFLDIADVGAGAAHTVSLIFGELSS